MARDVYTGVFSHDLSSCHPPAHASSNNVQKNYRDILWARTQSGKGIPPDSGAAFIPIAKARGLSPRYGELLSYEVPTYFGMMCVAYESKELGRWTV